jgi:small subunit ribosomal protein S19
MANEIQDQDEEMSLKKKEFSYRGKSLNELKQLDIREFAKLLKSNERRTIMRQYDKLQNFVLRCNKKSGKSKLIKTHKRDLIIIPQLVGLRIHIYDGRTFVPLDVNGEMIGHRLGEFAPTRTRVKHGAAGIGATKSSSAQSVK